MMINASIAESLKAEDLDKSIKECRDYLSVLSDLIDSLPELGYIDFELAEREKMLDNGYKEVEKMLDKYIELQDAMIEDEAQSGNCRYCHKRITSIVLPEENMRVEYSCGC